MTPAKRLCLDPAVRGLLWSPHGGSGLAPDVESLSHRLPAEHSHGWAVPRGRGELELHARSARSRTCPGSRGMWWQEWSGEQQGEAEQGEPMVLLGANSHRHAGGFYGLKS